MNIIVCVDGKKHSREALKTAIKIVKKTEGKLTILHSLTANVKVNQNNKRVKESLEDSQDRAEEIINEMKEYATQKDVDFTTHILSGYDYPIQGILSYLQTHHCDLVVIGHRALDDKHEKLFGSFAKEMISKSPVPVTVVSNS